MKNVSQILHRINDFVKVKENLDSVYRVDTYSNRLKWLMQFLEELNITYVIEEYGDENDEILRNICIPGTNDKMIIAHYDIFNFDSDNANDNSASVMNAIATKYLNPEVNITLTDAEEFGGEGAKHLSRILTRHSGNPFPKISWILNLELTGLGDKICVSRYSDRKLYENLTEKFNASYIEVNRNDAYYLNRKGFDCEVATLVPTVNGELDISHFRNCHRITDSISTISLKDMERFVLEFLLPISK
jgi:hypothetical protein